ncbi:hypothetical protein HZ326_12600 [Fusarium oxysporum f. sp. albedinis]|nr:hypothetical protein HZ326_12600 [Fusarium oxysporum f. sp. albedinis]
MDMVRDGVSALEFIWPSAVQPLDPDAYTSANLVYPLPYKVNIKPRSVAHVEAIKRELESAEAFLSQYN